MPSVKSAKSPDQEQETTPVPSQEELNALLATEIEKSEKLAGSQLHMAEWFLQSGKIEIARRRLQLLIETLPESSAAARARQLIGTL